MSLQACERLTTHLPDLLRKSYGFGRTVPGERVKIIEKTSWNLLWSLW